MKQIQWFPGHMAKALREIKEQIKAIDIVIELVDARAPFASRNPEIIDIIGNKPHLLVMTKNDLADEAKTREWLEYFKDKGKLTCSYDVTHLDYQKLKKLCQEALKDKIAKDKAKGLRERPIRALIVGIPNVGKSTLINKLAGRKAANVENRPGVTKAQQYIKVDKDFILLDTPGVLWPNFEDKKAALNLALIGTIKETILPLDFMTCELLKILTNKYPGSLNKRYAIDELLVNDEKDASIILDRIAISRKFVKEGNINDLDRALQILLKEFANGMIGRFTLESVSDYCG